MRTGNKGCHRIRTSGIPPREELSGQLSLTDEAGEIRVRLIPASRIYEMWNGTLYHYSPLLKWATWTAQCCCASTKAQASMTACALWTLDAQPSSIFFHREFPLVQEPWVIFDCGSNRGLNADAVHPCLRPHDIALCLIVAWCALPRLLRRLDLARRLKLL